MSHTPGPWELGHLGPHGSFEIGKGYSRPGILSYDGFVIAGRAAIEHKADEMRANALLMAASPDLLDALQAIMAGFESGVLCRNTESDGLTDWALKAAPALAALAAGQRAIAKATGTPNPLTREGAPS